MSAASGVARDYGPVLKDVRELAPDAAFEQRLTAVADAIWTHLGGRGPGRGVSWVGFYRYQPDASEMVLEVCRDKPACSPLAMHGACGTAWRRRRALVVRDVACLGRAYIACDPQDRSEAVVPLIRPDGSCWGVLDVDSHEVGGMGKDDAHRLILVLLEAGILEPAGIPPVESAGGEADADNASDRPPIEFR